MTTKNCSDKASRIMHSQNGKSFGKKSLGDGPASTAISAGMLYFTRISFHLDWLPWIQLRRMFCDWNLGSDPGAR